MKDSWEKCNIDAKSNLIAFDQVRALEDAENVSQMFKI